jgi:hypothetical protein
MSYIRGFSSQLNAPMPARDLEDAPAGMRPELVDAFYYVAGQTNRQLDVDRDLYFIIEQSLGCDAAGSPSAGKRQRIGRDLAQAPWQRVYDLIERLWPEYQRVAAQESYREAVNRVLAGYSVAWELGSDGRLHRVLPSALTAQIKAALEELSDPRFAAALQLYNNAVQAYDSRPRRDRDACANMFDALESGAKEVFQLPHSRFYEVLATARTQGAFTSEIINVLEAINTLRNRHFGHGMTAPFQLAAPEVDFAYTSCLGAILLFTRRAHAQGASSGMGV